MTTIAWDGHTLAADKLACFGTTRCTTTKIFRVPDPRGGGFALAGYAGDAAFGEAMVAWITSGAAPETFPAAQRSNEDWVSFFVVRPGMPVLKYERTPYPVQFHDELFALGSGREFALAAMYLGKTAREAVEVAIALDTGSGGGIDTLTL